jgi:hypothetical protein
VERYTKRLDDGQAVMDCQSCKEKHINDQDMYCSALNCRNRLKDRLAAYEELDLEPQEIERIVDAYGRGMSLRTECALRLQIIREIPTNLLHEMARDYTGKKNVNVPCKRGDPVYIIVNPGGRKTVRPTYVTRIEIDELMRPVIHTNCGFGLWGDRIFLDRTSAEKKIAEKKGDQHGEQ